MRVLRAIGMHVGMDVVVVVVVVIVIVGVMGAIEVIVIVGVIAVMPVVMAMLVRSCRSKNREAAIAFSSHVRKPRRQSFEHSHSSGLDDPPIGPVSARKFASTNKNPVRTGPRTRL